MSYYSDPSVDPNFGVGFNPRSKCPRCLKNDLSVSIMSYFNTEQICIPCSKKEREHPEFRKAQDAETQAVKDGNYNYKGIGKPSDL